MREAGALEVTIVGERRSCRVLAEPPVIPRARGCALEANSMTRKHMSRGSAHLLAVRVPAARGPAQGARPRARRPRPTSPVRFRRTSSCRPKGSRPSNDMPTHCSRRLGSRSAATKRRSDSGEKPARRSPTAAGCTYRPGLRARSCAAPRPRSLPSTRATPLAT